MLNFNFKQYGSFLNQSGDESIIPYYGQRSTKQFIKGNPIRFKFKLWCITHLKDIFFMQKHVVLWYCGVDTDFPDIVPGQSAILCWV